MSGPLLVNVTSLTIRIISSTMQLIFWNLDLGNRDLCSERLYRITPKLAVLGIAEEWLQGLRWHQNKLLRIMGRKLRCNVGDPNIAPCVTRSSRERVRHRQLLLLYCLSDTLLMQQSCGHSKSNSNGLSWAHFAYPSGGKGT